MCLFGRRGWSRGGMERRARREPELPAIVVSTAATIRRPVLPAYGQVLRHHRWGAGLLFVTLFAATLAATLVPTPVYRATALIDANGGTVLPLTRTLAQRVLGRELQVTREALAHAGEALEAFRRDNPALPEDPRDSLEYRKLADLNDALTRAQSRRMEKEALHKQVTSGNPGLLSQVVSNQVVAGLATEVAKLEAERARLGEGAGGRMQAQIDALR